MISSSICLLVVKMSFFLKINKRVFFEIAGLCAFNIVIAAIRVT